MRPIPRVSGWDQSLDFLADPYRFIGRHCRLLRSDVVQARLLLRPTLCFTGSRAAELFYNESLFCRAGAAPEPLRATLLGKGGVQGLDGSAHRRRKALFMRVLAPEQVAALVRQVSHEWEHELARWAQRPQVALYTALHPMLTRAVCHWAGVPLPPAQLGRRTRELVSLFDEAVSPAHLHAHLHARRARWSLERWLATLVEDLRAARRAAAPPATAGTRAARARRRRRRPTPPPSAAAG